MRAVDTNVSVILVTRDDRKQVAAAESFACHPEFLGGVLAVFLAVRVAAAHRAARVYGEVVTIELIGQKKGNVLLIGRKEFKL